MQQTQPGRVVGGRYLLREELGSGGFGRVWRARDEFLDVEVAVKEMRLPGAGTAAERSERLARARREARNAAKLRDHPHIVAVYDVVIDEDVPWTVMQLVDGVSLADRLAERGPLPVAEAAPVAAALLSALGSAHEAGIVHRDVKPANVMLTAGDQVLLTDFGIAVHQDDPALTAAGMFIGSVEFTAPERLRGAPGTAAGDLFSLGVTLYQALEGVSPFRRDSQAATMSAVLFDEAPPPRRAGPLAPLLEGLMAKDPERRPGVAQARQLLASVLGTGAAPSPGAPPASGVPGGVPFGPPAPAAPSGTPGTPAPQPAGPAALPPRARAALAAAETAARGIPDESGRVAALTQIAKVLAAAEPHRAAALLQEGQRRAAGIADGSARASALAGIAEAMAGTDRQGAAWLADEAERLARGVPGGEPRARALGAAALAHAVLSPGRAEQLARAIPHTPEMVRVLAEIARKLAAADPGRAERLADEAARLAGGLADDASWPARSVALGVTALAFAATDPDRAEYLSRVIPDDEVRANALAEMASELAAADPGRAKRLADEAERLARGFPGEEDRADMLAAVAKALAGTSPDRAARLADEVEHTARARFHTPRGQQQLARAAVVRAAADPHRAESLAQGLPDAYARAWALTKLAKAWASPV